MLGRGGGRGQDGMLGTVGGGREKGFARKLFSKLTSSYLYLPTTARTVSRRDATNLHRRANAIVVMPPPPHEARPHSSGALCVALFDHVLTHSATPRLAPLCPSIALVFSSLPIPTPPSPAQIMTKRTLKLAVATHLLLWGLCHGAAKGVSGE